MNKLEGRAKGLQGAINQIKAEWKVKEAQLLQQAEESLQVKFKEKLKKTLIAFKEEVSAVKIQYRTLKKEQLVSDRVMIRM